MYPIVDIFAGPGGLGEGFSSVHGVGKQSPFRVVLSVEKEINAVNTLIIRSTYHILATQHSKTNLSLYYDWLASPSPTLESLEQMAPAVVKKARKRVFQFELGKRGNDDEKATAQQEFSDRIRQALGSKKNWVLVGGPPCQAYSLIGRVKNQSLNNYTPEADLRFTLYREYLNILSEFQPTVFLLENVKGILSARYQNKSVIHSIMDSLQQPSPNVKYQLFSLVKDNASLLDEYPNPADFVIHSEDYGVPQNRHRLIILGVRDDIAKNLSRELLIPSSETAISAQALNGLPALRSHLSKCSDTEVDWKRNLLSTKTMKWYKHLANTDFKRQLQKALDKIEKTTYSCLPDFNSYNETNITSDPSFLNWIRDERLVCPIQHESRSHMSSDIIRYLFVACYTNVNGTSPRLDDFPDELLPAHKNIHSGVFVDRFKSLNLQKPVTTVTSHISKDGHYYIHPDPLQCRSLTVREAARLQTFPDNYFFSGNRTEQFHQVGNAVPPFLAKQIAIIIEGICNRSEGKGK